LLLLGLLGLLGLLLLRLLLRLLLSRLLLRLLLRLGLLGLLLLRLLLLLVLLAGANNLESILRFSMTIRRLHGLELLGEGSYIRVDRLQLCLHLFHHTINEAGKVEKTLSQTKGRLGRPFLLRELGTHLSQFFFTATGGRFTSISRKLSSAHNVRHDGQLLFTPVARTQQASQRARRSAWDSLRVRQSRLRGSSQRHVLLQGSSSGRGSDGGRRTLLQNLSSQIRKREVGGSSQRRVLLQGLSSGRSSDGGSDSG
jgi:hypothetical protein